MYQDTVRVRGGKPTKVPVYTPIVTEDEEEPEP